MSYQGGIMSQNNNQIEAKLWSAAEELRVNSKLKSSEYSVPVRGLIFLQYEDIDSPQQSRRLRERAPGGGRLARRLPQNPFAFLLISGPYQ